MERQTPDRTELWRVGRIVAAVGFVIVGIGAVVAGMTATNLFAFEFAFVLAFAVIFDTKRSWWGPGPAAWVSRRKAERKPTSRRTWITIGVVFAILIGIALYLSFAMP